MKKSTQQLINLIQNEHMLNEAVLAIQGYIPQSREDKENIHIVRKILITLRDGMQPDLNKAIEEVEK